MHSKSISVTLTCAIVGLMTLLVVVAASAVTGLVSADRHLAAVDRTWLSGIERLGDLKIRIAQIAAAADPASLRDAQAGAARDLDALGGIVASDGSRTPGERNSDGLARFQRDWSAFRDEHGDAIVAPANRVAGEAVEQEATAVSRRTVLQERLDALVADAKQAAGAEIAAADGWAKLGTGTVAALTTLAGLLTIGLLGFVELHVTTPLGTITGALTRLAGGQRDVQVPELHRTDEIGAMATAFEIFRANAVALAEAQERAEALARHDALTGLPNRRLFASALDKVRNACIADGAVAAVMLIDLDRFKPVNDLHGHATGDAVLCEIAVRLRTLAGAAMVARLGGDEFAIILPGEIDRRQCVDAAIQLAGRVVATASEPIALPHARIVLGASIGISLCPSDGGTAEEVLRTADLAMYRAKHDGRGRSRFFEASMDEELRAKVSLETDIRLALARNEIEPHYQPLVELASDRIVGFEILARWPRPGQELVPPDRFIPIIEQLGLLDALTSALLTRALRDARHWPPHIRLAVNISPAQFQDVQLPTRLASLLMAEGFLPQRLEVEVTETALIGNLAAARTTLDALRSLGVRVVLDDFGTGYSSLSHLREFRFDKIKIDRSFIRPLRDDADSCTIVDAMLGLARNLGLPTVAEGIEDADVRDRLAGRGCSFGQGYWFSRAVPAEVATAMLAGPADAAHATRSG